MYTYIFPPSPLPTPSSHQRSLTQSPFIVFNDAHIHTAARAAVVGAFTNTGQDCTAVARIYVQRAAAPAFIAEFLRLTKQIVIGMAIFHGLYIHIFNRPHLYFKKERKKKVSFFY
jgi:hypothetical protein